MFDRQAFEKDRAVKRKKQHEDPQLQQQALSFFETADKGDYAYQWDWLGLPIIQTPEDVIAVQEIIWQNKPDVIVETGIAWGGSIVFYASLCALLGGGKVLAVDKVLPQKNRDAIMGYPFSDRIHLFEGSSTDRSVFEAMSSKIRPGDKVMVLLDSNHTHDHVYEEMKLWGPLVTKGQYLVVSDTIVEKIAPQTHRPRPWGIGNNPQTAVDAYLKENPSFSLDNPYHHKALFSCTKGGYLLRI
ncbi:cephalosporin hydroxylase [bacterium NHP-B]|nr:cephalosporin hydroxylase [bacterium NHP-B]